MNALLQHRGHKLLSAGHSIAVQNFNENLSILIMLCLYALLIGYDISLRTILFLLSLLICIIMGAAMIVHRVNQRRAMAR
jgi:hypothetical protein